MRQHLRCASVMLALAAGSGLLSACDGTVVQPRAPLPEPPVTERPRPMPGPPGPPVQLLAVDNCLTLAGAGSAPPYTGMVRVLDAQNRGVPGIHVTFAVVEGSGTLSTTDTLTDAAGYARPAEWRLSTAAGPNRIKASAPGLGDVELALESVDAPPTRDSTEYILQAARGAELPLVNAKSAPGVTLLDARIRLDRGTFQASYRFARAYLEVDEVYSGTYTRNGAELRFDKWQIRGVVSADGRLQLCSDEDDWAVAIGVREEFVKVP